MSDDLGFFKNNPIRVKDVSDDVVSNDLSLSQKVEQKNFIEDLLTNTIQIISEDIGASEKRDHKNAAVSIDNSHKVGGVTHTQLLNLINLLTTLDNKENTLANKATDSTNHANTSTRSTAIATSTSSIDTKTTSLNTNIIAIVTAMNRQKQFSATNTNCNIITIGGTDNAADAATLQTAFRAAPYVGRAIKEIIPLSATRILVITET